MKHMFPTAFNPAGMTAARVKELFAAKVGLGLSRKTA